MPSAPEYLKISFCCEFPSNGSIEVYGVIIISVLLRFFQGHKYSFSRNSKCVITVGVLDQPFPEV